MHAPVSNPPINSNVVQAELGTIAEGQRSRRANDRGDRNRTAKVMLRLSHRETWRDTEMKEDKREIITFLE